jgi:hypothetical protein
MLERQIRRAICLAGNPRPSAKLHNPPRRLTFQDRSASALYGFGARTGNRNRGYRVVVRRKEPNHGPGNETRDRGAHTQHARRPSGSHRIGLGTRHRNHGVVNSGPRLSRQQFGPRQCSRGDVTAGKLTSFVEMTPSISETDTSPSRTVCDVVCSHRPSVAARAAWQRLIR